MSSNYSNNMMNALWNFMAPGFYNYGRIDPDADVESIPDLSQANEDMVHYLIAELGITKDARLLELGCGKGMYTIRIAEETGCTYTGIEINEEYVENECKKRAKLHGVSDQGEFITGSMIDLLQHVRNQTFTHIMMNQTMYYCHNDLNNLFDQIASVSTEETKIFSWDFVRRCGWEDCKIPNSHLKLPHPILTKEEVFRMIEKSKLDLAGFVDATDTIIPGYKIMERECRKRDPDLTSLTYPRMGRGFMTGLLACVYYHLKLQTVPPKMNIAPGRYTNGNH
ncbi:uncharacterized protein LOC134816979 [Bolinopsis microptera]|uniref:uncharacterized protein LOC134816979 n=1 Tax=Bolinopsis microptera TaxID=2820187 RepID=UPI003079A9BF